MAVLWRSCRVLCDKETPPGIILNPRMLCVYPQNTFQRLTSPCFHGHMHKQTQAYTEGVMMRALDFMHAEVGVRRTRGNASEGPGGGWYAAVPGKQRHPPAPDLIVLIITAHRPQGTLEKAEQLSCTACTSKPRRGARQLQLPT